jgi:transaldolase
MNLLQLLHQYGQSVWLDGFERGWISRGELQRYIEEDGLTGVRSNFQSLQAAIESQEYDRDFITLAQQGISQTAQSDYDYLIERDLQLAADLLKQVHSQTQGHNGYVQIDLPPVTLFETQTAITTAKKIWQSVGWSNLLLGIPAIPLLLPVIEQLISDRINVNATFVFSPARYEQVFNRYLTGLERLVQQGKSVSEIVCFVSVPIGRLNEVTDSPIANSEASFSIMQTRLLYERYRMLRHSERWQSLPEGVKPLRLVWDCTDIPPESAWRYLQQLAFPETVMMLSPSILEMYREVSLLPTSLIDAGSAEQSLIRESQMEISLNQLVEQFVNEEITRSLNAFHQLLNTIEHKRVC